MPFAFPLVQMMPDLKTVKRRSSRSIHTDTLDGDDQNQGVLAPMWFGQGRRGRGRAWEGEGGRGTQVNEKWISHQKPSGRPLSKITLIALIAINMKPLREWLCNFHEVAPMMMWNIIIGPPMRWQKVKSKLTFGLPSQVKSNLTQSLPWWI